MTERVTRSRVQSAAAPVVSAAPPDPASALVRQLSDAKQGALAVLQDSSDGLRRLPEATAKVLQASTQLMEMVREDLAQPDDQAGEGGGLGRPTTARLPLAQAGKAVALLVDCCHLVMRGVLEALELVLDPWAQSNSAAGTGPGPSNAPPPAPLSPPLAAAQLWRCGVNVANAMQDATRLLTSSQFYLSYSLTDPSCNALLSIGELAAAVMRRAAAATAAAAAAATGRNPPAPAAPGPGPPAALRDAVAPPGCGPEVVMKEAGEAAPDGPAGLALAWAGGGQAQGTGRGVSGSELGPPPDVACLLAAHGYSLLLVACEQQPEGLLDALQDQPGAPQRLQLLATAALELAAARIAESAVCCPAVPSTSTATSNGGGSGCGAPGATGLSAGATATQHVGSNGGAWSSGPEASSAGSPAAAAPSRLSYQVRQLQLVALRFSELLADDGGYKRRAREALMPALAEVLLAEPNSFASWWGCGQAALYAGLPRPDLIIAPQLRSRKTGPAEPAGVPGPGHFGGPAFSDAGLPLGPSTSPPQPSVPGPSTAAGAIPAPSVQPPDCRSTNDEKLRSAAVGLLLKSPVSRRHLVPLLLACARLPYAGSGLAAFGEGFHATRFICGDEGPDGQPEELFVGGRGKGYKRRKVLNPDAHGVDSDLVGAVTGAMAAALECAVLLCRILSNASIELPSDGQDTEKPGSTGAEARQGKVPGRSTGPRAAASYDDEFIGPPGSGSVRSSGGGGNAALGFWAGAGPGPGSPVGKAARRPGGGGGGIKSEPSGSVEPEEQQQQLNNALPLAGVFLEMLMSGRCGGFPGVGDAAAAVKRESGDDDDGRLNAARAALARMARNVALLLSLLQPVCPNGGEEVREPIKRLGFPALRWPRGNVRLPVLVVAEDCELLVGLMEDLHSTATESQRREAAEQQQRDADARRQTDADERRRKRHEAEQKEAERRQRDKERRQRDRDRLKAMKLQDQQQDQLQQQQMGQMPQVYGKGMADPGEDEILGPGSALGFGAGAWGSGVGGGAPAGGGPAGQQPKVRLVIRRGGPVAPGGSSDGTTGALSGRQRRTSTGDEADEADVGPDGAGLPLGVQVPRQRRSTRPARQPTPTPPPEAAAERDRGRAATAGGGDIRPTGATRRRGPAGAQPYGNAMPEEEDEWIRPGGGGGGGAGAGGFPAAGLQQHGPTGANLPPLSSGAYGMHARQPQHATQLQQQQPSVPSGEYGDYGAGAAFVHTGDAPPAKRPRSAVDGGQPAGPPGSLPDGQDTETLQQQLPPHGQYHQRSPQVGYPHASEGHPPYHQPPQDGAYQGQYPPSLPPHQHQQQQRRPYPQQQQQQQPLHHFELTSIQPPTSGPGAGGGAGPGAEGASGWQPGYPGHDGRTFTDDAADPYASTGPSGHCPPPGGGVAGGWPGGTAAAQGAFVDGGGGAEQQVVPGHVGLAWQGEADGSAGGDRGRAGGGFGVDPARLRSLLQQQQQQMAAAGLRPPRMEPPGTAQQQPQLHPHVQQQAAAAAAGQPPYDPDPYGAWEAQQQHQQYQEFQEQY